ncbi:thiamine pyrophosphate-dependent enzyme [Amycolatopsis sp. NBC_01488]|uniref:thiamine pyrophosphate-dependent enzyme n=1 Tax=Amycolatopsis sp. NBC_01488 TaxID=2903563 RepID=UPI002E2A5E5A|nr:thiamine pyrophosphate-dependent enzyme [Amycolatopsis sp. NBC_01488]
MNKTTAIAAVLAVTPGRPVVFTTGYACRVARHLADRPGHFYMTGSMGLASSIGIGLALTTGRPTVVVDGDGALLMNPVGPLTAGTVPGLPLVHVVLDDAAYASTGGQDTPRADIPALARACGYSRVTSTSDATDLRDAVGAALTAGPGPAFVHAVLTGPDDPVPPRVDVDLGGHARTFRDFVTGGCR